MPKLIDYPRASFENAYEVLLAVYELGDGYSIDSIASKMKRKQSGAFTALVSSAVKYGLIEQEKGCLKITTLGKHLILSYDDNETKEFKREAFFNIPMFNNLYERYKGKRPPLEFFPTLLEREFNVLNTMASRVTTYFITLAEQAGLLDDNKIFIDINNYDNNNDSNLGKFQETIQEDESKPILRGFNIIKEEESELSIKQNLNGLSIMIVDNEKPFKFEMSPKSLSDFTVIEAVLNNLKKDFDE